MIRKFLQILLSMITLSLVGWIIWRWQVNGWSSLIWVASAIGMMLIRAPFAKRTRTNQITKRKSISIERLLLALVAIGGTYLPLLHLSTGVLGFANYELRDSFALIGALLLFPALWLFWRSHADLGENWSVTTEIREDQELVVGGIYKSVRHPMYASIWALFLLQPLFVHNWIAGFSGTVTFALMYFIRVPYEEEMMRELFGSDYDLYCEQSGRLWPRLRSDAS